MTQESLESELQRLPRGWGVGRLGDLPTVQVIGYGITRPGAHIDDGVPMIRAADIQDGRLSSDEPRRIASRVHETNLRSQLEVGDVVVVLVGRVGEAAVVSGEFRHWNASRTVAIIRASEPDEAAWLSLWLGSSAVRDWCERQATGSTLQRTLSLAALRSLPVPMPPTGPRAALLRATRLLAAKTTTNVRIAECATELSDARFACETRNSESWPEQPIAGLVHLTAGSAPRPRPDDDGTHTGGGTAFVAPADILQSNLPHLYSTERRLPKGKEFRVCAPGSLLVASREDGVRAVMNQVPVAIGRGVLVLGLDSVSDAHWLLHEIRSRGAEFAAAAHGSAGRELSRSTFGAIMVRWPPSDVRERFARLVGRLHERARIAQVEDEKLRDLRGRILDSFLTGAFPGKSAS